MDLTSKIIAYEQGELSPEEQIFLFAELVRTGLAWQLQGHYGRSAAALVNSGVISRTGQVINCVGCGD